MSAHRHLRRTDLFLVRVWAKEHEEAMEADDNSGETEWCGRVQRVVNGESHQFSSWQGLVDALLAMLSSERGG